MRILIPSAVPATLLAVLFTGCEQPVDPAITALQQKLLLSSEPAGEMSVSRIRAALEEDGAADEMDVVIRGRIHAGDSPPWEPGQAAFVLTDAAGHEGEQDHDPHTCPFCSIHISDYLAMVRFPGEDGSVVTIDSRDLLGVTEKQLVVVTGKGRIEDDGLLGVTADGIYLVR